MLSKKNRNLLEKDIITNNCLLRDKDKILNLLKTEIVCKKNNIYL
jgi:hypothetical protein